MLWLPKWLRDNGAERLEAEMPSRRTFLFLGAAAVVGAALPAPLTGIAFTPGEVVYPVHFARNLYGRVTITPEQLFMGGRRGGKTAFVDAMRRELAAIAADVGRRESAALAIDARATHGMVEHHGLIVPKHTPQEVENARWWSQAYRAVDPGRWDDDEKARMFGQPAHDNADYRRDFTYFGINRRTW